MTIAILAITHTVHGFTPAEISPLAWYRTGTTVMSGIFPVTHNNPVTMWLDSSGNGNHLACGTSPDTRPVFGGAGFIQGDGGDYLACARMTVR